MLEEERDVQSDSVEVEVDAGENVSPESSEESLEENASDEIKEGHFPKKKAAVISACLAAVIVIGLIVAFVAIPSYEYSRGMECLGQGNYQEAKDCFSKSNKDDAGDYISYCDAMIALADGDYEAALASLDGLDVEEVGLFSRVALSVMREVPSSKLVTIKMRRQKLSYVKTP